MGKIKINHRVDYLSFPILGKLAYKFKNSSSYILFGPRIDIFLGYNIKDDSNVDIIEDDSVYKKFESIDFGGTLGVGYEFNLFGSQRVITEIRYSPSITNSYETDFLTVSNSSFEFLTGIKF